MILIIIGLIFATLCAMLAGRYQRSRGKWAALGFFFGIIALLVLAIMGHAKPTP